MTEGIIVAVIVAVGGVLAALVQGLRKENHSDHAIVAVSLIVGGVGIMNIMYVTVTERTAEIGLRKAVGASNGKITLQFLIETVIITLIGGLIGLLTGILVSFLAAAIIRNLGYSWDFSVSPFSIFLALGVSAAIGLFFGLYPARKAAKMDPVEALRYE